MEKRDEMEAAREVARIVKAEGGRALLVGGCVRDWLLGGDPKDIDVECFGIAPERLKAALSARFALDLVGAQSRHMLWDIVRIFNKRGATIFLTTHYMDEAEALCDRISIINKGEIIATGTPKELCKRIGVFTVEYDSDDGVRKYAFFHDRESAKKFFDDNSEKNPSIRSTHLEDVFLEKTGRLDIKSIEVVL